MESPLQRPQLFVKKRLELIVEAFLKELDVEVAVQLVTNSHASMGLERLQDYEEPRYNGAGMSVLTDLGCKKAAKRFY